MSHCQNCPNCLEEAIPERCSNYDDEQRLRRQRSRWWDYLPTAAIPDALEIAFPSSGRPTESQADAITRPERN